MIDPVIGSALISGGVNALGSLLGLKSGNSAAEQQMKIAQMQMDSQKQINQQNLAESQRNRDFQQKTINDNFAWNSAAAQVQRYKDAGLNPYLMMQHGGQSVSSSGAVGSQGAVQNADGAFDIMSNAQANKQSNFQTFVNNNRQTANDFLNAQAMATQNQKNIAEMYEVVQKTHDDSKRKLYQNFVDYYSAIQHKNMSLVSLTQDNLLKNQVKLTYQQELGTSLDNAMKEISLKYHNERESQALQNARAEWDNLVQRLALDKLNGKLTMAQIKHELVKVRETWSKIGLNYEQSAALGGQKILWKFVDKAFSPTLDYLGSVASGQLLDFVKRNVGGNSSGRKGPIRTALGWLGKLW